MSSRTSAVPATSTLRPAPARTLVVEARDQAGIKAGDTIGARFQAGPRDGVLARKVSGCGPTEMTDLELWYKEPAAEWTEALPLGNGRLGAMVFGGVERERLQLNEDTLYAGGPYSPVNPEARGRLDEVRGLIFDGSYALAEALADRFLMGMPLKQMSYQPAGDLWLDFGHADAERYRRSLDLDTAIATTTYAAAGRHLHPRKLRLSRAQCHCRSASAPRARAQSRSSLGLTSLQPGVTEAEADDTLAFSGTNRGEHGIDGALRLRHEGQGHNDRRFGHPARCRALDRRSGFGAYPRRCRDELPALRRCRRRSRSRCRPPPRRDRGHRLRRTPRGPRRRASASLPPPRDRSRQQRRRRSPHSTSASPPIPAIRIRPLPASISSTAAT